jgi:peptidoglycan-associated lipoprotein
MQRKWTLSVCGTVLAGLAACSSTPVAPTNTASGSQAPAIAAAAPGSTGTAAGSSPAPASQVATVTLPAYLDPSSQLASQRSVFFDFDVFTIRGADTPLIERHGRYLATKPTLKVKIEGNSDERGSPEYNLALGQKRAEAVLRALKIYGVRDGQVEAVSWGESKPRAVGSDEAAWAVNRRADLQYPRQ